MSMHAALQPSGSSSSTKSTTPKNITYTVANEFLKLLEEEYPAQDLLAVLRPGVYTIGKSVAMLQWDGKVATHTPPGGQGEVEVYNYLVQSSGLQENYGNGGTGGFGRQEQSGGMGGFGRQQFMGLGREFVTKEKGSGSGAGEMVSPWARGWADLGL